MLLLLTGLVWVFYTTTADPIVHAPWGQIQGVQDVTDDLSPYYAYHAIPYALPPTGQRRFAKPVPHPGVQDRVFNASSPGPRCMQTTKVSIGPGGSEDEDCLTLDVYTPSSPSRSAGLPVIVYIHGGGFTVGNSDMFPGGSLTVKGVIMVIMQYRLGPFGFLSTGDDASPGNYGLWDQHMALQWVKRNIRAFGGDVNKITLMGESAGSASVSYQALFEGSKGLFQRIIMQSGSATSTWAITRKPVKNAYELAQKIGCVTANRNHTALVNCLRAAPAADIVNASWPIGNDPVAAMTEYFYVPSVDGKFVKDDPMKLVNSPRFLKRVGLQDLDCMVAVNSNEGGLLLSLQQAVDETLGTSILTSLANRTYYRDRFIPHLLELYFGKSSTSLADVIDFELTFPDTGSSVVDLQKILDTFADPSLVVPTIDFGIAHASTNTQKKTYMYLFDHTPTFLPHVVDGLVHGGDVYYAFGQKSVAKQLFNVSSVSQDEKKISDIFMSLLTDFVKTGNPSPAVKSYIGGDWPQFTSVDQDYLVMNRNPSLTSHPFRRRVALWTDLLPEMLASGPDREKGRIFPDIIG